MDGFGISNNCPKDATKTAKTPNLDELKKSVSNITINASGEFVGLPEGQMGNSEVGHLNLGAGRVVYQELSRINNAVKDGSFFKNEVLLNAVNHAKKNNSSIHFMGLLSSGGVHSAMEHVEALVDLAAKEGLKKVYVHAFLDGRDTPPKSAKTFLERIENKLKEHNLPQVATVSGRYYAMDRDNRWDRVEKAYNCLLSGEGEKAENSLVAVDNSYAKDVTDEFVLPTVTNADVTSRINDNDAIVFFNFRPDRAREITRAINFTDFNGFERKAVRKNLNYVMFTKYDETFDLPVAFPPHKLTNILGDVLDANGIKQYRTAETEKYAHVTFFFNGGGEQPFENESRILVNSPKVPTYDLKPEMSALEVTDKLLAAIRSEEQDLIILNYANGDMIGHTGVYSAIRCAVSCIDGCVETVVGAAIEHGYTVLITADHGNADYALNEDGTPNTAHSLNDVPFIVVNAGEEVKSVKDGALCNVAPTILKLMGIAQPEAMTAEPLV